MKKQVPKSLKHKITEEERMITYYKSKVHKLELQIKRLIKKKEWCLKQVKKWKDAEKRGTY